jgi:amidase
MVSQKEWQKLIDQKREDRESQIPEKWRLSKDILDKVSPTSNLNAFQLLEDSSLLSKQEIQITEEYTAQGLLSEISRGELTAFEVCSAFCKRAAIAQQLVRLLPNWPGVVS